MTTEKELKTGRSAWFKSQVENSSVCVFNVSECTVVRERRSGTYGMSTRLRPYVKCGLDSYIYILKKKNNFKIFSQWTYV